MLYCPTCGTGYEDLEICPSCEEKLTPIFDQEQLDSPLVELETEMPEAFLALVRELLEDNGIFCILRGTYSNAVCGNCEGVTIMVPEIKKEQAKELVHAFFMQQQTQGSHISCPDCGHVMPDYKIFCPNCGKTVEEQ